MSLFAFPDTDEAFDFADYLIACRMNGATNDQAVKATMSAFFRDGRWVYRDRSGLRMASRDWAIVRGRILERDHFVCAYCDGHADEVDHVMPLARGGNNDDENLAACCGWCNRSKGAKLLSEWLGFIQ